MRKQIWIISAIIITAVLGLALGACAVDEPPEPVTYKVTYSAYYGGSITGETSQTVESGGDAKSVTAVPNDGYTFKKWSDGLTTATRTDTNVTADISVDATFEALPRIYTITYIAGEHGRIEGEAEQKVESGGNGTPVTAVPDEGYKFIGWSDGIVEAERQDYNIRKDKTATAKFEQIVVSLGLNYQSGTANSSMKEVSFNIDNYKDVALPVPTKEHFTFDGWYLGHKRLNNWVESTWFSKDNDLRVSDESGMVVVGKEIWDYAGQENQRELYAKWKANETFTYKILLVYITRIDATLPSVLPQGSIIHVDYTMSQEERQLCQATTKQMKRALDGMMDGLVKFEIDEYFTTQTVVTEDFRMTSVDNGVDPSYIPEVRGMLDAYQSALSVYSLDFNLSLHSASGSAGPKYGEAFLDSFLYSLYANNKDIDDILTDLNRPEWEPWLEVLIHELSHTIEMRINAYSYHESCVDIHIKKSLNVIYANKLYYLREIDRDGIKAGIPYNFWKGDIAEVHYVVDGGIAGFIWGTGEGEFDHTTGDQKYAVVYGEDAMKVTATPSPGYRFVGWSDGITTAERTDRNITGDLTVTAYFEQVEYTIHYMASEGGKITGETVQTKPIRTHFWPVTAVAEEGYVFVGWSDGVADATRKDLLQFTDVDKFDENDEWSVTALFKKLE